MASGSTRAILAALFANAGIAIAKFVAWVFTNSSSMLAEAIHSVADTSNQALLLLGGRAARKEASATHPFGYGRERYFWSFVVALVLFSIGGLFAIYEGIEKLRHPHEIENAGWAIGVLILGLGLEGYSMRTAIVESLPLKGQSTWWQFIRHARTPELPVVLLEDLGALTGLLLALTGVSLSATTGNPDWDAYGTLSIGILLVVIAAILVVEMKSLLIGESAHPRIIEGIRAALEASEGVVKVIHMRTQHIGADEILVGVKVQLDRSLGGPDVVRTINEAERNVREATPMTVRMYVEPDIHDPTRGDADDDRYDAAH